MATPIQNQKDLNREIQETNKLLDTTKKTYSEITNQQKRADDLQKNINTSIQQIETLENRKLSLTENYNLSLKEQAAEAANVRQTLIKQRDALLKVLDANNDILKNKKKLKELTAEQKKELKEQNVEAEKQIKLLEEQEKLELKKEARKVKMLRAEETTAALFQQINKSLGVSNSYSESWLGKTLSIFDSFDSIKAASSQVLRSLGDTIHPGNLLSTLLEKAAVSTKEMAFQMDSVFAEFNRATGAGGAYEDQIDEIRMNQLSLGIGFRESADSMKALVVGMADFTQLSPSVQNNLAASTAFVEKLGISNETTARTLDSLTNAFQMTAGEAMNSVKEVAALATQLGVPPEQMAQQFQQALPVLVQFGDRSEEVFKQLAIQAKATGIELNRLVQIAEKFETFEGAATAAGNLNALLGGPFINSLELLGATAEEKLEIIRDGFEKAGVSYDGLANRYQKKAFADQLGVSVEEASRMLAENREEMLALEKRTSGTAAAVDGLAGRVREATSLQDKWAIAQQSLSEAAKPILDFVTSLAEKFLMLNDLMGGKLIPTIGILTTAFVGMKILLPVINILNLFGTALGFTATGFASLTAAASPWLIIGGAIVGVVYALARAFAALTGSTESFERVQNRVLGYATFGLLGKKQETKPTPKFAKGTTNFKGGSAIVGEEGPEMVTLPEGSNVITNENVEKLTKITEVLEQRQATGQNQQQGQQRTAPAGTRQGTQREIVLNLDGRELGRVMVDLLSNELDLKTMGFG